MARGRRGRRWSLRMERPPRWGVALLVVSTVAAAVLLAALATRSYKDPVTPAQAAAMRTAATAADAAEKAAHPLVVFLGDSYTEGTGASSDTARFSSLVSRTQGWREVNLARGGTGYRAPVTGPATQKACGLAYCPSYEEMISAAARQSPQIVVVSGGRNELPQAQADPVAYAAGVGQFYKDLRSALPQAKIIATSPVWDDDPVPAGLAGQAAAVRSGVQAVGGIYLDIGEPLTGHTELVAADGVHPDDGGHKALAAALDNALAAAHLGKAAS